MEKNKKIILSIVNELEKITKPIPTKLIQFGNCWINPEKIVSVIVTKQPRKGYAEYAEYAPCTYVATLRLSFETEPYFGPSFDTEDECKDYITEFITKNNL
jgi:hypothetical protein